MIKTLGTLAAALGLAACAVQPTSTDVARGSEEGVIQTGSRLPYKGTDRIVRTIGSETFKNDDANQIKSISNITGARSN